MNEIKALLSVDTIDRVENNSDQIMTRARIHFKNGHQMSVIYGFCSHGSEQGLFEISVFSKDGEMDGSFLDKEDQGDVVCGYLSVDRVKYYIKKIGALK